MTPYELGMCAAVYQEAKSEEFEGALFAAYMTEIWHRTERLKPFSEIMKDAKERPVDKDQMSDLDMLLKVMQLNSALDGEVSNGEGV